MSIETDLSSIAKSLGLIAAALSAKQSAVATPAPAPVQEATKVVAPVEVPAVTPAPVMPPVPVFTQAVPTPTVTEVVHPVVAAPVIAVASPFKTRNEFSQYVIDAFKSMGPEKGMQIQQILADMGHTNISHVPEDQWLTIKTKIDGLRG